MNETEGFAVSNWRAEPAGLAHALDKLGGEPVHQLLGLGAERVGRHIHAADGAGQAGDCPTAAKTIALEQRDFYALARGGDRRGQARCPTTNHQ